MIGKNEIVFVTMLVLSTAIVAQVIIYNYFFAFNFFLLHYFYLKLVFFFYIFLDANAYVQSEQKVNHLSFECANLKQYGDIYMRNKCPNDW